MYMALSGALLFVCTLGILKDARGLKARDRLESFGAELVATACLDSHSCLGHPGSPLCCPTHRLIFMVLLHQVSSDLPAAYTPSPAGVDGAGIDHDAH